MPDAEHGGVTARADVRLPGHRSTQRASAAIDGDPTTAWTSIYQNQVGHYLEYTVPEPLTFDHLDLEIVADGRHSVPTQLGLDVDGERVGTVDIPPIDDLPTVDGRPQENGTVPVRVAAARTGHRLDAALHRRGRARGHAPATGTRNAMTIAPVAIAELGIDGLHLDPPGPTPSTAAAATDLLSRRRPARCSVRVTGLAPPTPLARRRPLDPPTGLRARRRRRRPSSAGEHIVRTGVGRDRRPASTSTAWRSPPSGAAPRSPARRSCPTEVPPGPAVTVDAQLAVESRGTLAGTDQPFWLVMGQSWSNGWSAQVDGVDLGAPVADRRLRQRLVRRPRRGRHRRR